MTCRGCQKSNWNSLANLLDDFYLDNRQAYHSILVQFCRKNQIISVTFFFIYTSKSKQAPNFDKIWITSTIGNYRSFEQWKHFSRSKICQSVSIRFLAPTQQDIFYHSLPFFCRIALLIYSICFWFFQEELSIEGLSWDISRSKLYQFDFWHQP